MSRTLYSATMSLDGYISAKGGDMSWLGQHLDPHDPDVDVLMDSIGALLVGKRTYAGDDPNANTEQEGAFNGKWSGPAIVVTHHVPEEESGGAVFMPDLLAALDAAREAAGDKYVNVLGADIARQLLELGQLDEILVFVAPVLLGAGTPLFRDSKGTEIALERLPIAVAGGLHFRVRPGVLVGQRAHLLDRRPGRTRAPRSRG